MIMMGTVNCVYETPCGWCAKFDKKCDRTATSSPDKSSSKSYVKCIFYSNGKCSGTKELDPCQEEKCGNVTFKINV